MCPNSIMQPLYVPIDIGKNVHCYGAYAGVELVSVVRPTEVRTHGPGYDQFRSRLKQLIATQLYAPIVVGMEPTGVYHEPWAYALHAEFRDAVRLYLVEPFHTKQKRKQLQNRALRKSDATDVEALAYCLRDGSGRAFGETAITTQELQLLGKRYSAVQRDQRRLGNRLHSLLDRTWPGACVDVAAFKKAHPRVEAPVPLVATLPLQRTLVQTLLGYAADPYFWRELTPEEICATLRGAGMACGPKTAQKVWRVVHELLLPPPEVLQPLLANLRSDLCRYVQLSDDLDDLQRRAIALLEASPGVVVATVPGIGRFLAAQYVGVVGDVSRFDHADQVWALVGFDTIQTDSGDRRYRGKLTKRGQSHGRAVLYQMGLWASKACPVITQAKSRALQRGKSKIEANIHAAHKTNRLCFHLLKHGVPYDPQRAR